MTYLTWLGVVYLGIMIALTMYRVECKWCMHWSRECVAHGVVGSMYILTDVATHMAPFSLH